MNCIKKTRVNRLQRENRRGTWRDEQNQKFVILYVLRRFSFLKEKDIYGEDIPWHARQESHNFTVSTIIRMTEGNFRLINRLLKQSLRIMKVNRMTTLTKEIIEAA